MTILSNLISGISLGSIYAIIALGYTMGLAPILVEQIFEIIQKLHKAETTILLVEQNAQMALSIADRGYVLETGKIVTAGSSGELLASSAIKKAYLGG